MVGCWFSIQNDKLCILGLLTNVQSKRMSSDSSKVHEPKRQLVVRYLSLLTVILPQFQDILLEHELQVDSAGISEGADVKLQLADDVFGNAMTSRIDSTPHIKAAIRSNPNAIPHVEGNHNLTLPTGIEFNFCVLFRNS